MAQQPERYDPEQIREAIEFLNLIKDRFPAKSATREEFFALFAGLGDGRTTDARAVVARANELLQDHTDLVDRFHAFLDPKIAAQQFLKLVRQTTDMELYDAVIAELERVREEPRRDAHDIYARFRSIFGPAHDDLLRRFARFLPIKWDPPTCAGAE